METAVEGASSSTQTTPAPVVEVAQTPAPVAVATEAPPSSVQSSPEFDWDSWDGEVDKVPETYREPVSRAHKYFSTKFKDYDDVKSQHQKLTEEHERLSHLYDAALEGFGDDPRLGEIENAKSSIEKELLSLRTEYAGHKEQFEAYRRSQASEYADRLYQKQPKYFTDDLHKARLADMLNDEWDPEVAIELLEMGDAAVSAAAKAREDGASDSLALKFAELSAGVDKNKPQKRDAARVMAGSAPTSTPAQATRSLRDAKTFDEQISMAAERALKLHSGGK